MKRLLRKVIAVYDKWQIAVVFYTEADCEGQVMNWGGKLDSDGRGTGVGRQVWSDSVPSADWSGEEQSVIGREEKCNVQ